MFTPCNACPARPVEPGTLRVFNWGGMRSLFLWGGAYCTGALCTMPRSPISVLKRLPGKQGSDLFIVIRQKMSGNTTQMRGINAQYESIE